MKSKTQSRLLFSTGFIGRVAIVICATSALSQSASAATGTWLGNSGDWNVAGTWNGGTIANGTDSSANFTGVNITADQTITLTSGQMIGNITFTDATTSSNNLLITGNTLTLDVTTGAPVIDVTQSDRVLTIGSVIDGNDGLLKTGSGTLTLTSANLYTGDTTVNGGTLSLNSNSGQSAIQGVLTVNSGGTVVTTGDGTGLGWNFSRPLTTLNINGGTVTSAGTMHIWSSMTGGVNMTGGMLQSNSGVNDQNGNFLEWGNVALNTSASAATATIAGRIRMRHDQTDNVIFTVADGAAATDLLVSAAITEAEGSVGITKAGAGTMSLTGTNTFTGATTVNAGTLALTGYNALQSSSGVFINNTGTVLLKSENSLGNPNPKAVTIASGGLMTMDGNFSVNIGVLTLNGGELSSGGFFDSFYGSYGLNGDVTVGTGTSTISAVNVVSNAVRTFTVASGGTLNVTGTFSGANDSGLGVTKTGAGTMIFSGANTYTGTTTVSGGVLSLATGLIYSNLGFPLKQITINGGATVVVGGWGDGASAGLGQVSFSSSNILVNDGTIRYTGGYENGNLDRGFTIGASGATLYAAGGANTFTLNQGRNFGITSDASGTLTLTGSSNGVLNLNLGGAGGLVKSGTGVWSVTGSNTYTGTTTVTSGTLNLGNGTTNSSLADTAGVVIGTDPTAVLNLNYIGTDTVAALTINGVVKAPGVYGSSDPSGRITGSGTLTVGTVSPYTTWANSFLPGNNVSNPAGDNDNDGLTNQQEFAFGLSPILGSSVNPILVQLNKTTGQFSYQRLAASGLTYKVLTSTTLAVGSWTQDVAASQVAGPTDGNGNQTVVVTLTGAPLAATKLFVRVSAE